MDSSSSDPLSSGSPPQRVSRSVTTNDPVTVRNVSVVEGGNGVGPDADGGMNTGSDIALIDGDNARGPTAIPAEDGDVAQPLLPTPSQFEVKAGDDVATRKREAGPAVKYDDDDDDDDNFNDGEQEANEDGNDQEEDDDAESDYSYEYEEEEETHYAGFLIPTEFETQAARAPAPISTSGSNVNVVAALDNETSAAKGASNAEGAQSISRGASSISAEGETTSAAPATSPSNEMDRKQKWKEPTQAAINMSLRAEKEKTGGRRRLASDLYKIMMADTKEAGFSLEPCDEDAMDRWLIKLFGFDEDSNMAKDLMVLGMESVELEMSFPDQYPFEPPFVRVVRPRFKKQTGFVMSGALCMELLTKDGWNPINDIESVIVSIRSLMVVGDGRLQAAFEMGKEQYELALAAAAEKKSAAMEGNVEENDADDSTSADFKRKRSSSDDNVNKKSSGAANKTCNAGAYSAAEASQAYDHLSKFHKSNGWDKSGWWAKKG